MALLKNPISAALCAVLLFTGFPVKAKKKSTRRDWSVSFTNGRTFYNLKSKNSPSVSTDISGYEGQMNPFFSSLEISRNFGYYEWGGKLQFFNYAFVSPFFKLNFRKNHRRARLIPSLTLGLVPSPLFGGYTRAGLSWFFNQSLSVRPFAGVYGWYRKKPHANYIKFNIHVNAGLTCTIYF